MINRLVKAAFVHGLDRVRGGTLQLVTDHTRLFGDCAGDLHATLAVSNDRFFTRALTGGDVAIGEAYMDGDWTSPDLVALIRLMIRNLSQVESGGGILRAFNRLVGVLAHRLLRDNDVTGSRQNIHRHYDLGNDFFRLFLDTQHLMYSCAYYGTPHDTLETAQERKIDRICRKLDLGPDDRLLEIGTGWGGFAVWAATQYGCHVTTTTISEQQYAHAREWTRRIGAAGSRIVVLHDDYRRLTGQFDKIVSVEMFEAVGLKHYDEYFDAVNRLLAPDGMMLLQTITVDDEYFPHYQATPNWIEKYIFPGGELASVREIGKSLARGKSLFMGDAEDIGPHYARTLHAWRERFHARLDDVRELGFDERFIRMWDLYLAYCEAAFLEGHTRDFQLVLAKDRVTRPAVAWGRADLERRSARA